MTMYEIRKWFWGVSDEKYFEVLMMKQILWKLGHIYVVEISLSGNMWYENGQIPYIVPV